MVRQPFIEFAGQMRSRVADATKTFMSDTLKGKIMRSVGWMGVGYSADMVLRFISSIILTRLLDPSAYGLITTVTVFLAFAAMLSDIGIRPLVLTDPRGDEKPFLGTLWTLQVLRGFILAIAVGIVALVWQKMQTLGWIGPESSYSNPLLPQLLLLVSLSLVVAGFTSLNQLRAIRHLDRGRISRFDIAMRLASTIITVVLVFMFRSVWAMAVSIIIAGALRAALTHSLLPGPAMTLRLDWPEIRKVLATSRWVALNSTLTVLTAQADKLLIGYAFGLEALGVYSIALTLFTSATTLVTQLNNGMGIPVLRALADKPRDEQERAYYRFRMPVDLYCIAVGTGMALLSPIFFKLVYDPRYIAGGTFMALLGIKIVLMPLLFYGNFLMTQMRFKMTSMIGLFRSVVYLSGLAIAMWFNSIEAMVFVIALERTPEILLYFTVRRVNVPFHKVRDGLLLIVAGALSLYLLLI